MRYNYNSFANYTHYQHNNIPSVSKNMDRAQNNVVQLDMKSFQKKHKKTYFDFMHIHKINYFKPLSKEICNKLAIANLSRHNQSS